MAHDNYCNKTVIRAHFHNTRFTLNFTMKVGYVVLVAKLLSWQPVQAITIPFPNSNYELRFQILPMVGQTV